MFKDKVKLNHHSRLGELPQQSSGGVVDAFTPTALIEVEILGEDPETDDYPGAFVESNLQI